MYSHSNKPKALQLLVYSYLYLKNNPQYINQEVISGIFSFKVMKSGLITLSKKEGNKKPNLMFNNSVLQETERILTDIISKILSEDFVQTSEKSNCLYCNYKSICNR